MPGGQLLGLDLLRLQEYQPAYILYLDFGPPKLDPHLKIKMVSRLPQNFYSMQYALISKVTALKLDIFSQLLPYICMT